MKAQTADPIYTFEGVKHAVVKRSTLWLEHEPNYSPISDDYTEDIDPRDMFRIWASTVRDRGAFHEAMGEPWVSIYWSVFGSQTCETAPLQSIPWCPEDFLSFFTWPVDERGERVNWLALPVRSNCKTAFIEKATGWLPSPLQPVVSLAALEAAAA